LEIRQGFAYLENDNKNTQTSQLSITLSEKENQLNLLQIKVDSLTIKQVINDQVFKELKIQYPTIISYLLQPATYLTNSGVQNTYLAIIQSNRKLNKINKKKIENWLKVRMKIDHLKIYFE
jgi:translation initiation factor 6 (eIF-6)